MTMIRKTVSEETIPEVADFMESERRIERLKEAYPEVFEQLDMLKEDYNTKLQAAEKAVRAQGVSCGPFTVMSTATIYDADKLFEELGREDFLKFGGIEKTITKYELDRARFEAAYAKGAIPKAVFEGVKKITTRFRIPDGIKI